MNNKTPSQPPWGRYIQERRERQNRSIRQVSYGSGISDSYWGQVERGFQTTKDGVRTISPSRSVEPPTTCCGVLVRRSTSGPFTCRPPTRTTSGSC